VTLFYRVRRAGFFPPRLVSSGDCRGAGRCPPNFDFNGILPREEYAMYMIVRCYLFILLAMTVGCSQFEQVSKCKREIAHWPIPVSRSVPVQYYSERDYLASVPNDGKWQIRRFQDSSFAAPAGVVVSEIGSDRIPSGICTLVVVNNTPGEAKPTVQDQLILHGKLLQKFTAWKSFFMNKESFDWYLALVSSAIYTIGEAEKIEFVDSEERKASIIYYDRTKEYGPLSPGSTIIGGNKLRKYCVFLVLYNKKLKTTQKIKFDSDDLPDIEIAAHRILSTYSQEVEPGKQGGVLPTQGNPEALCSGTVPD
jgi:hypothetical protein